MQIQKCLSKNQTEKQQPLRWRPSKTRGCSSTCYQKIWEKTALLATSKSSPNQKMCFSPKTQRKNRKKKHGLCHIIYLGQTVQ